jgi:hypothetical protein
MTRFVSDNSYYTIKCPDEIASQVAGYVNRVERYLPILEETFGLEPRWPFGDLVVRFGSEGPCHENGRLIKLPADMNLVDPQNIYGGLFHQTAHGLLEGYLRLPDGRRHYLPEAATVVLQVAALERIEGPGAREWARRFADGWGCTDKQRPILHELVRIYRDYGFAPIRSIYAEMADAICPAFYKETLVCDLNRVLRNRGVKNLISL